MKRGLTWVLSRYRVSISRYPRFFEEVTVTTWPSGLHGYFARRDLDMNRHVNNVVYIHWALEAVNDEVAAVKRPVDLEVSYRAEAFYNEDILSSVGPAEDAQGGVTFLHRIVRAAGGTELAPLRTRWA